MNPCKNHENSKMKIEVAKQQLIHAVEKITNFEKIEEI